MAENPILILQMQRMGDLVMTFPLLGWLGAAYPGTPIWVVGEPDFFNPLMPLSPSVTYFSYSNRPKLDGIRFTAVINLSHRRDSAEIAAMAAADAHFGYYAEKDGSLRVKGDWQLYRASLIHNNHYNLYHWSDLNAMDLISGSNMLRTTWPPARPLHDPDKKEDRTRIGIFLGASEPEKRPDAPFWTDLTRLLIKAGHKPVLLGGTAEKRLGMEVAAKLKAHPLNLCGNFKIRELAEFMAGLDLVISPDTGPMHVSAWTGTPTINLSMGPVNPWETGPPPPGHHVVRSYLDCIGCWGCTRQTAECRDGLSAGRISSIIAALIAGETEKMSSSRANGMEILRTARDRNGNFNLLPLFPPKPGPAFLSEGASLDIAEARMPISRFWQAWFGEILGRKPREGASSLWLKLENEHPKAAEVLFQGLGTIALFLAKEARGKPALSLAEDEFWQGVSMPLRPLSGYIQVLLQNNDAGKSAILRAAELVERLTAFRD